MAAGVETLHLEWYGQEFKKLVEAAATEGLFRGGQFYHAACQKEVSRPNTGVSVKAKDMIQQAKSQLGSKPEGLIRYRGTVTRGGKQQSVQAWHYFRKDDFKPRMGSDGKSRQVRSITVYPNPSKPGEPPRLRTGFGRRNIVINYNKNKGWVRVGIAENAVYMFYLEVGTRRVKRRPWLVNTLFKNKKMISLLIATGGRKGRAKP